MLYESIIFSASGDLLHSGGVCTLGKFEDRYEYYRYFQNKIFTDGIRNVILLSNFNALSLSRGWYQVKKRDIWRSGWVIMFNIGAVQGPTLFEFRFFRCMYRFSLFSVWMPLDGSNWRLFHVIVIWIHGEPWRRNKIKTRAIHSISWIRCALNLAKSPPAEFTQITKSRCSGASRPDLKVNLGKRNECWRGGPRQGGIVNVERHSPLLNVGWTANVSLIYCCLRLCCPYMLFVYGERQGWHRVPQMKLVSWWPHLPHLPLFQW